MKKISFIALALLVSACGSIKNSQNADKFNFDTYKGKTISTINYSPKSVNDGDVLNINFKDGGVLRVYSDKKMKILK